MTIWVNLQLDRQLEERIAFANSQENIEQWEKLEPYLFARQAIEERNFKKLLDVLAKNPEVIPDLQKSLRTKGRPKGATDPDNWLVKLAAEEVDQVYELWLEQCGKRNRRRDNRPSAVEIVAERHGLTEEVILGWRKDHKRELRR
jgi:hypothetical protein